MPSAGAVRLRVAISTRASARRWAEVRASSSIRGWRPSRSLASRAVGLEELALQAVELGRRRWRPTSGRGSSAPATCPSSSTRGTPCATPGAPRRQRRPPRGRPAASSTRAPARSRRSPARTPGRPASPRRGPWRPRCGGAGPRRWPGHARSRSGPPATPRRSTGRWRNVRPRRTRRRATGRGTRQRVAIQAAAVLAPSAAHSSPASNAAVASVTNASKRASSRWSISMDAQSP